MNRFMLHLLLVICLLFPVGISAGTKVSDKDAADPIVITLEKYKADGYSIIGPVQYLDRSKGKIILYRHPPVAYTHLRVTNEMGRVRSVKKGQFVYVLSKKGRVILIRLNKKEGKDV